MGAILSLPPRVAIYSAALYNRAEVVKAVIHSAYGGVLSNDCLEWSDADGHTALTIAVSRGHATCVKLLLDLGANCHHVVGGAGGGTALHIALECKEPNLYILSRLLEKGANPFVENYRRRTAWEIAAGRGLASVCRLFEKKKALFAHHLKTAVRDTEDDKAHREEKWICVLPRYASACRGDADACAASALYLFQSDEKSVHRFRMDLGKLASPHIVQTRTGWNVKLGPKDRRSLRESHIPNLDFIFDSDRSSLKLMVALIRAIEKGQRAIESSAAPKKGDDSTVRSELVRRLSSGRHEGRMTQSEPALQPKHSSAPRKGRHGHSKSCGQDEDLSLNCSLVPPCTPKRIRKRNRSAEAISSPKNLAEDSVCVICLENRPTAGLVHGSSVHRCVCQDCIKNYRKADAPSCPVCRRPVEHIITDFF